MKNKYKTKLRKCQQKNNQETNKNRPLSKIMIKKFKTINVPLYSITLPLNLE